MSSEVVNLLQNMWVRCRDASKKCSIFSANQQLKVWGGLVRRKSWNTVGLHQSDLLATAFVGNALGKEKAALGAEIISPVMKTKTVSEEEEMGNKWGKGFGRCYSPEKPCAAGSSICCHIHMSQPRSSIRHVHGWCEESQAIHAF